MPRSDATPTPSTQVLIAAARRPPARLWFLPIAVGLALLVLAAGAAALLRTHQVHLAVDVETSQATLARLQVQHDALASWAQVSGPQASLAQQAHARAAQVFRHELEALAAGVPAELGRLVPVALAERLIASETRALATAVGGAGVPHEDLSAPSYRADRQALGATLASLRAALDEARQVREGRLALAWGGVGLGLLAGLGLLGFGAWRVRGALVGVQRTEDDLARKAADLADFGSNMRLLHRLSTSEYADMDELFRDYLSSGCQMLDVDMGSVSLSIDGTCVRRAFEQRRGADPGRAATEAICGAVFQSGQTALFQPGDDTPQSHPMAAQLAAFGLRLHIGVPIAVGRSAFGVLSFAAHGTSSRAALTRRDIELVELMARSLAARLAESERQEQSAHAQQALAEASRLKSEFLAVMSHEIRTPLAAVIGMTELLQETGLDERQRDYVETVRVSSEMLHGLINDVLDLSKIEAGHLELECADFDPRRVVLEVLSVLRPRARSKGLALEAQVAPDVPVRVHGDGGRFRQVLTNLVTNAVKFTERGSVTVRLACGPALETGIELRGEVRDTGPGIATEDRVRLFQPFSQLDSSLTRRHGGTGLGLAISRQLVERMGGRIGVESEPGQGSTFWFTTRVERARHEPVQAGVTPTAAAPATGSEGPRVLVAEDDPVNRRVVLALLGRLGYRADAVDDGRRAVEAALSGVYAVVLMDCSMPEMDGIQATQAIRRAGLSGATLPILALTANALESERRRCLDAGMDGYLSKPVRSQDLHEALTRALAAVAPGAERGDLTPSSTALVLDVAYLDQLADPNDADFLPELIRLVLKNTRERLAALKAALSAGDLDQLAAIAHALQGGTAHAGARALSVLCGELERQARAGQPTSVLAATVERAEAAFTVAHRELYAFSIDRTRPAAQVGALTQPATRS